MTTALRDTDGLDGVPIVSVSDFVELINQSFDYIFPLVVIEGELSNFRVSKNKWVYFDLRDGSAIVKCFAIVHVLSGPLEDGMTVRAVGVPRLHELYNFSFQVQSVRTTGVGSIQQANNLLAKKLKGEGLFDVSRKRALPAFPRRIALITAADSAAYADFTKISQARWAGLDINVYSVLVQGANAPAEIVSALTKANQQALLPDVIVMVRGGGSVEDLAAWSDESVVRAVAASRAPTLVAIGHETDVALAELAADLRASTPSNAAELLVPDKRESLRRMAEVARELRHGMQQRIHRSWRQLESSKEAADELLGARLESALVSYGARKDLLAVLDPMRPLAQGYAIVRTQDFEVVRRASGLVKGSVLTFEFVDGTGEVTYRGLRNNRREENGDN